MTLRRGNTSICNIKGHFDYTFTDFLKMKRKKMTNRAISVRGLNVLLYLFVDKEMGMMCETA
jgi:hypothetical protein